MTTSELSRRRTRHALRRAPRLPVCAAVVLALTTFTTGRAAAAEAATRVAATQQLAVLLTAHRAHVEPRAASAATMLVAARRPITGEQTTLPVVGSLTGPDGVRWLRVMLPGRPNSSMGWIAQQGTRASLTPWHVVISLAGRRVGVYRDGRLQRSFQAVVGKPSTPTPTGQFFVEESLQMASGEPGGPFALALSARSDALQEFEGGPGQIAIHGRDHLGGALGSASSHGCVRLATASIDWLVERTGPGTPVTINGG